MLVGGFNHLEKYESQWMVDLSQYIMENKTCLKPPISHVIFLKTTIQCGALYSPFSGWTTFESSSDGFRNCSDKGFCGWKTTFSMLVYVGLLNEWKFRKKTNHCFSPGGPWYSFVNCIPMGTLGAFFGLGSAGKIRNLGHQPCVVDSW